MRKSFTVILLLAMLACRDESDVPLASGSTFVRYFGSENNHTAHLAEEAHNGYTLLNTIEIQMDFGNSLTQIQLTHLDYDGNVLWKKKYPSVEELQDIYNAREIFGGFKASTFIKLNSGYLIVGDSINQDENTAKLLLIKVDTEGSLIARRSIEISDFSLHGKAVATDAGEQYFYILGKIRAGARATEDDDLPSGNNDMYLAKITADLGHVEWEQQYGQGQSDPTNRLYTDVNNDMIWSTTVRSLGDKSEIRMISAHEQNPLTEFSSFVDNSEHGSQIISDFFVDGNNYVLIGTRNPDNLDTDLYYARVTISDGKLIPLSEVVYTMKNGQDQDTNINETGVSVCKAHGGGYVMLGNVELGGVGNGGNDYFVMGIDPFGNHQWSYNYGTAAEDNGASIRPTSDGGYLLYGTTSFGSAGLQKTMLMKLNKQGKL